MQFVNNNMQELLACRAIINFIYGQIVMKLTHFIKIKFKTHFIRDTFSIFATLF